MDDTGNIIFASSNDGILTMTYQVKMFIECITHEELLVIKHDNKRQGFFYVEYSPNSYVALSKSNQSRQVALQSLQAVEE